MGELSLRDQILELEEKLWVGGLGNLKVSSRDKWTTAISDKKYDMGAESLVWGEGDKIDKESLLERDSITEQTSGDKRDSGASTGSNSEMRGVIKKLAAAI